MSPLRHTIRFLIKSPGFAITAVLILGFGIGANTAIFSFINTVLLKPLPYPHPERLVMVSMPYQNDPLQPFDYPDYLDMAAAQTSFNSLALVHTSSRDLTGSGETQRLSVQFVSPSLFALTGRGAIIGRTFNPGQMLLETGVLSLFGGIGGLGLAVVGIEIIRQVSPPDIYRIQEVRVDLTALLFVGGVIVLVALISGVLPAFSLSKPKLG